MRRASLLLVLLSFFSASSIFAAELKVFSPQGEAKQVRQVRASFDVPVRPLGNPTGPSPLKGQCFGSDKPIPGTARWTDAQTWVMDFGQELPAGLRCEFAAVENYKDSNGQAVRMQPMYRFNTGGPNLRNLDTMGYGYSGIDENAIFFATATGPIDANSIERSAYCQADGIGERIPVRLVSSAERAQLLKDTGHDKEADTRHIAFFRCARKLPAEANVDVVWATGIKSVSGLPTTQDEHRKFKVRPEFAVHIGCERENANADCTPFGNITLRFTAPVKREDIIKVQLIASSGRKWNAELGDEDMEADDVEYVTFRGPFPPLERFRLQLPAQIRDDADRPLTNRNRLAAVTMKTAEYGPLLKFAADFGIVELNAGGILPVTLRNLDALANADRAVPVADGSTPQTSAKVRLLRLKTDEQIISWLQYPEHYGEADVSLLRRQADAKTLLMPKPNGAQPMEVVGIPLGTPGFYVAEGESQLLGTHLLESKKPMYVRTEALNTNLAVHLKRGDENALVWVTTLDAAQPVADARITIRDCKGNQLSFGKTNADGTMLIPRKLQSQDRNCGEGSSLYVFARITKNGVDDMSFVDSNWQRGIERWRFQLPGSGILPDVVMHTIFDRPLFRSGETVHMQHVARRHTTGGFSFVAADQLPDRIVISLSGGDDQYEIPISWKNGTADTDWKIPEGAKLGRYVVSFLRPGEKAESASTDDGNEEDMPWASKSRLANGGSFRVADFRLPVLKAQVVTGGGRPFVGRDEVRADMQLSYIAGGGAAGEKVRLRSEMRPTWLQGKDELEDFIIGTAPVKPERLAKPDSPTDSPKSVVFDDQRDLVLDRSGTRSQALGKLPEWNQPAEVFSEMEYSDPSGETRTAGTLQRWFPGERVAGIASEVMQKDDAPLKLRIATLDTQLKPVANTAWRVQAWYRRAFVHRKRMLGGYYSYDTRYSLTPLGEVCKGTSDAKGMAACSFARPAAEKEQSSAEMIVELRVDDSAGRPGYAVTTLWQGGGYDDGDFWFDQDQSERIDLIADKKHYEPGDTAQIQVRMPFREATALVSVEREGIMDRFVVPVSGKDPKISVPIKANYGPNTFVSVLAVRGRIGEVQPTALVDLGKPAYKLGITELTVGQAGYALNVQVEPDRSEYKAREDITARVRVTLLDGTPAKGGEFALAVVDEALLELSKNDSWQLLARMMGRRGYSVDTATAQSQVIGKRHLGLKAVPAGGGGGRQPAREVFDTLLAWQPHVILDDKGEARIRVPLNDSITAFRVVAVARQGAARFGSGSASVRSTRDLQLFAGLPPVVREGDNFRAMLTVRNLGKTTQRVQITPSASIAGTPIASVTSQSVELSAGEAREIAWPINVPVNIPAQARSIAWHVEATGAGGASDALKLSQKVIAAFPDRITAATLEQIDGTLKLPVQRPADALPDRGSVDVFLKPSLGLSTDSIRDYMLAYPYNCLEQQTSRIVSTGDAAAWNVLMDKLPTYFHDDGLVDYFPPSAPYKSQYAGSVVLTSYLLSVSHEAGLDIPEEYRERMLQGLANFVEGRGSKDISDSFYWSPKPDLVPRKLMAIEALSRFERATPGQLATIPVAPGLWPTHSLIDWLSILQRNPKLPARDKMVADAENQLRARLDQQGTMMRFSTEQSDYWWWMMASGDLNAVRAINVLLAQPGNAWQRELPRMIRGALARQQGGHWSTTTANAWGVLTLKKFAAKFEAQSVSGKTHIQLDGSSTPAVDADWATLEALRTARAAQQADAQAVGAAPLSRDINTEWRDKGERFRFAWNDNGKSTLTLTHSGTGKPWATVQTRAVRMLRAPVNAGFAIKKEISAIEQKVAGRWSRGDIARIRIEINAPSQWTWVVLDDPVPAGSTILGSGLAGQGEVAVNEDSGWWGRASFTERSFTNYRAYYQYFPQGKKVVEYAVRVNNPGEFLLPPTRIEAMYAPENYGEFPNTPWRVE